MASALAYGFFTTSATWEGFPGSSDGKKSASSVVDLGSIRGSGRSPGEGNGNPLQYSCLEKSHGWKSMAGYSPQGCKESDTTEKLHFTTWEAADPALGNTRKVKKMALALR